MICFSPEVSEEPARPARIATSPVAVPQTRPREILPCFEFGRRSPRAPASPCGTKGDY